MSAPWGRCFRSALWSAPERRGGHRGRGAACADERGTVGTRTNVTRWVLAGASELAGAERVGSLIGSVLP